MYAALQDTLRKQIEVERNTLSAPNPLAPYKEAQVKINQLLPASAS
jgi:hypothetical protein